MPLDLANFIVARLSYYCPDHLRHFAKREKLL